MANPLSGLSRRGSIMVPVAHLLFKKFKVGQEITPDQFEELLVKAGRSASENPAVWLHQEKYQLNLLGRNIHIRTKEGLPAFQLDIIVPGLWKIRSVEDSMINKDRIRACGRKTSGQAKEAMELLDNIDLEKLDEAQIRYVRKAEHELAELASDINHRQVRMAHIRSKLASLPAA